MPYFVVRLLIVIHVNHVWSHTGIIETGLNSTTDSLIKHVTCCSSNIRLNNAYHTVTTEGTVNHRVNKTDRDRHSQQ